MKRKKVAALLMAVAMIFQQTSITVIAEQNLESGVSADVLGADKTDGETEVNSSAQIEDMDGKNTEGFAQDASTQNASAQNSEAAGADEENLQEDELKSAENTEKPEMSELSKSQENLETSESLETPENSDESEEVKTPGNSDGTGEVKTPENPMEPEASEKSENPEESEVPDITQIPQETEAEESPDELALEALEEEGVFNNGIASVTLEDGSKVTVSSHWAYVPDDSRLEVNSIPMGFPCKMAHGELKNGLGYEVKVLDQDGAAIKYPGGSYSVTIEKTDGFPFGEDVTVYSTDYSTHQLKENGSCSSNQITVSGLILDGEPAKIVAGVWDYSSDTFSGTGPYSLGHILGNYNIFIARDFQGTHVVGPMVVGGNATASLGGVTTGNPYPHNVPDYFGTISGGDVTTLSDIPVYFGTGAKGKEYSLTGPSQSIYYDYYFAKQYVDFGYAMEALKSEASGFSGIAVDLSKTEKTDGYEIVGSTVKLDVGGSYEFTAKQLGNINVLDFQGDFSAGQDTFIIIKDGGSVKLPKTMNNGGELGSIETGMSGSVVFLAPNATAVSGNCISGHVVAPYAHVELTGGYFNGCVIADSFKADAEGHMWNYNGQILKPTPSVTPKPTVSPEPSVTPKPTVSPEPSVTPKPTASPEPSATPEPTASPEPSATPKPTVSPEPSATPEPTASPEPTVGPEPSATPEPTVSPEPSATPEPTVSPEPSATPEPSGTPEPTVSPEPTATPETTVSPEPSATPEPTASPEPSATPEPTVSPEPSATPEPTISPEPTATPAPVDEIKGSILITKELKLNEELINATSAVFYVALYADEECTERISEIQPVEFHNASAATIEFNGLELNKVYYVREVSNTGEILETGMVDDGTSFVPYYPEGFAVTTTETGEAIGLTFENQFTDWAEGFYRDITPTPTEPESTPVVTETPENSDTPAPEVTKMPNSPSSSDNGSSSGPVKTGDETPVSFFIILFIVAAMTMGTAGYAIRKKK